MGNIPLGHPGRTIKQAIAPVALVPESQGGKVDSLPFTVLSLGWLYVGGGIHWRRESVGLGTWGLHLLAPLSRSSFLSWVLELGCSRTSDTG